MRRLGALWALIVVFLLTASGCQVNVDQYIALGDSYTAGPGIVDAVGAPQWCFRSSRNYPNQAHAKLVAAGVEVPKLFDVSCNGATVDDLYTGQVVADGSNIPQLAIVGRGTKVVTIGIGANDIGFGPVTDRCITHPAPTGCKDHYVTNEHDELRDRIAALRPRISEIITTIRAKTPATRIVFVGYPTIFPADGVCPALDVPAEDIAYLSGVFADLNGAIRAEAVAHGALFVDTAATSVGHDICAGADAWINPPGTTADPDFDGIELHPNEAGMSHTATLVATAIEDDLDH